LGRARAQLVKPTSSFQNENSTQKSIERKATTNQVRNSPSQRVRIQAARLEESGKIDHAIEIKIDWLAHTYSDKGIVVQAFYAAVNLSSL
jgi:hypothetical protein